jgi:hypothetical protein
MNPRRVVVLPRWNAAVEIGRSARGTKKANLDLFIIQGGSLRSALGRISVLVLFASGTLEFGFETDPQTA